MPSDSRTTIITAIPMITKSMTKKLPKFYFILSLISSFFAQPASRLILNVISALQSSQFIEVNPFYLLTAVWLPISNDFSIHSFRQSSWIYATDPVQEQGEILRLSSSQQIRHLRTSLGSMVSSDCIILLRIITLYLNASLRINFAYPC